MIGKQTSSFLYDMGVRTVATLREMPIKFLVSAFGKNGMSLWNKAQGVVDHCLMDSQACHPLVLDCGNDFLALVDLLRGEMRSGLRGNNAYAHHVERPFQLRCKVLFQKIARALSCALDGIPRFPVHYWRSLTTCDLCAGVLGCTLIER